MKREITNRLTNAEIFKLCQAMQLHLDEIKDKQFTRIQIAEYFTDKIGIKVTPGNIDGACKILNIELFPKREPRKDDLLLKAIVDLYNKLGEPLPEYLS